MEQAETVLFAEIRKLLDELSESNDDIIEYIFQELNSQFNNLLNGTSNGQDQSGQIEETSK